MKMIAFYNNKGGVGKTSTAINIAYTLSRRQNRILLVDFDGQCNSSRFFTDLTNDESGCERAIVCTDEKPLIKKTRYDNIDIVTSSVRMNSISNDFANLSDEEKQSFLKNKNYEVRYEKHITVHKIGEKKAIRVDTLAKQFGSQYTKAELEKAMGYSTNLADTNTSNLNLQSKKTCARKNINEWQRFESWSFSQGNR